MSGTSVRISCIGINFDEDERVDVWEGTTHDPYFTLNEWMKQLKGKDFMIQSVPLTTEMDDESHGVLMFVDEEASFNGQWADNAFLWGIKGPAMFVGINADREICDIDPVFAAEVKAFADDYENI